MTGISVGDFDHILEDPYPVLNADGVRTLVMLDGTSLMHTYIFTVKYVQYIVLSTQYTKPSCQ
jgi:hypothetical protein